MNARGLFWKTTGQYRRTGHNADYLMGGDRDWFSRPVRLGRAWSRCVSMAPVTSLLPNALLTVQ